MEKQISKVDVIIVGAGISGLVSAIKILEKERALQIKVLEANQFAGGQMGVTGLQGLDAKWITTDQEQTHEFVQQLNIPLRGRRVMAPELPRCWDLDRGITSAPAKYELLRYMEELEVRVLQFRIGRCDFGKGSRTMHNHICNRLFFKKSRQFMFSLVKLFSGVDAKDISFTEFMSICYSCGGIKTLVDLYLEWPNTLQEISSEDFLQALLDKLKSVPILYSREVCEIRQNRDYVEVTDCHGDIHVGEAVILAIPWNCVGKIYFTPGIPSILGPKRKPQATPKTHITSFNACYCDGYWRLAGYSGDFFCTEPIIVGHEYRPRTYTGIAVHHESCEMLIRPMILRALGHYFGKEMLFPCDFRERTYTMSVMNHPPLLEPWHRVIWASSAAAATNSRGFLDGAIQSGLQAAVKTLLLLRPQTINWQDVVEVKGKDKLRRRRTNAWSIWSKTLNLYNITYYILLLSAMYALIRSLRLGTDIPHYIFNKIPFT